MDDPVDQPKPVLAVLISGGGRTLANSDRAYGKRIAGSANRCGRQLETGRRGLEIAQRAGIPAATIVRREFESDAAYSDAVFETVEPYAPSC
ncbi:MAG: hypothetical protein R2835_06150 [Thermomicrobiales bacterium]